MRGERRQTDSTFDVKGILGTQRGGERRQTDSTLEVKGIL